MSPIFKDKVKDIFDRVCNAISVREKWFFGLPVETNEGLIWLKNNKELLRQPIQPENGIIHIKFLVKVSFIFTFLRFDQLKNKIIFLVLSRVR